MSTCINCPRESMPSNFICNGNIGPFCRICWDAIVKEEMAAPLRSLRSMANNRSDAFEAVNAERVYQDQKWDNPRHTEPGIYLVFLRSYLRKAEEMVTTTDCRHLLNRMKVMHEFRKIAAQAIAAMEEHGVVYRG